MPYREPPVSCLSPCVKPRAHLASNVPVPHHFLHVPFVASSVDPLARTSTKSVDDYLGVVVPLEEAHLHSHSARTGRTEFEDPPSPGDEAGDAPKDREESEGMLEMSAAEYSVEGLRREVRAGKGDSTDYEMRSKLINKAIQDIGMGKYNWQLFILCGFGWFADNLWMQGVSLCLPSLSAEFDVPTKTDREESEGMLEMSAAEYSIEGLRREVRAGKGDSTDYEMRSKLINKAIQDIGMGKYNWQLFILCGFGWFADNLWMQGVSLCLPSLSAEFDVPTKTLHLGHWL
ncbi:MFS siderochrome iron transporter 1 like protein [Verticillium longisporum]|nr:MFS siderochrome iron transporter 1 like protein [Verticillium longisporum]